MKVGSVLHQGTGGFPLFHRIEPTMMTKTTPNRIPTLMAPRKMSFFYHTTATFLSTLWVRGLLAHDC